MSYFQDYVRRVLICYGEFGSLIVYYRAFNFDLPPAWRLMEAILTVVSCKAPSNLSPHKDLSYSCQTIWAQSISVGWPPLWPRGSKYVEVYLNKWFFFEDILDSRDGRASKHNMFPAWLMLLSNFMNWSRGFYADIQCQRTYVDKMLAYLIQLSAKPTSQ